MVEISEARPNFFPARVKCRQDMEFLTFISRHVCVCVSYPKQSMGLVYFHIFTIKSTIHVGKYTIQGCYGHLFFSVVKIASCHQLVNSFISSKMMKIASCI